MTKKEKQQLDAQYKRERQERIDALSNVLLGERLPFDILFNRFVKDGGGESYGMPEVIIEAGRKIPWRAIRQLASAGTLEVTLLFVKSKGNCIKQRSRISNGFVKSGL
jgi:hypothetical protein